MTDNTPLFLAKQKYLSMFERYGDVASWLIKHQPGMFPEVAVLLESILRDHDTEDTEKVFMTSGEEDRFDLCVDLESRIVDTIATEEYGS